MTGMQSKSINYVRGTLKLRLLLWFIAQRMLKAHKTSSEFRETIQRKQFVIQMSGPGSLSTRYFEVDAVSINSRATSHPAPDLRIHFPDPEDGVHLLIRGGQTGFMYAVQEGKVILEGDLSILFWFSTISRWLRPRTT